MRPRRLRLEFRVELNGQVPRMARQLGNLHELAVGRSPGDPQAVLHERSLVQAIELVAVAVALLDLPRAVHTMSERTRRDVARVAAEPHCPAELVNTQQVSQLVNDLRG